MVAHELLDYPYQVLDKPNATSGSGVIMPRHTQMVLRVDSVALTFWLANSHGSSALENQTSEVCNVAKKPSGDSSSVVFGMTLSWASNQRCHPPISELRIRF